MCLLCLLGSAQSTADTAVHSLAIETPRNYGYFIGDTIQHQYVLALNSPYRLQQQTLPEAGRIDHWLQRYPVEVMEWTQAGAAFYQITLNYQIINLTSSTQELATPEYKFYFSAGEGALSVVVPQWRFRASSLLDPQHVVSQMQADQPPPQWVQSKAVFWLCGAGVLLSLGGFLYIHGRWPFWQRHNGPFAQACRQLRQLSKQGISEQAYLNALRIIHRAFNQTAGRTVFAEDLESFFVQNQRFQKLRQPIERYFTHSRARFFGLRGDRLEACYSPDALLSLCRDCRDLERGLR